MLNYRALLCLVFFISVISCSEEDLTYDTINVLPMSSIEYTETIDGVTSTEIFEEGAYHFEDLREYPYKNTNGGDCELFRSGFAIVDEHENGYYRAIGLSYWSHVKLEQVQDNQVLFHNPSDFEQHMTQEYVLGDLLDLCNIPEGRTGIAVIELEGHSSTLSTLEYSSIEKGEMPDYTVQRLVYNNLGYLVLDAVFDYTAKRVSLNTGEDDLIPTIIKFKHAIRFPELDK